ncbi:hypothetical protein SEUCBS139899_008892 [Sporothrix eucalyptigena]|uniref:Enoyl reductase (ER) domain-containing protein n=1 Tax=Sporothrix eucalyptigena TaxID=1812306 RepID=A0ABP0CTP0_9PEZI
MTRTTTALVVPELNGKFKLKEVSLEALQPDEALIEIHASGVCHTDLNCALGRLPCAPNAVLGHEGGGVVVEVGANVTEASVGDKVLLSFASCGACASCESKHPAYCYHFNERNFGGRRPDGTSAMFTTGAGGAKQPLYSTFFGQSSFARLAVVHKSSIVKVPANTPLELFAPLGCGIQTGFGAIVNSLKVKKGSSVAIFGVGSVGLAAVMAAKAVGAATIIAVDLHAERLKLAQDLGATHGVIGGSDLQKIVAEIRTICPPAGVDFAVDCAGVPIVVETMVAALGMYGRAATVGAPGPGHFAKIDIMEHLFFGKEYVGCTEGNSNPPEFIPYLIDMHAQGKLPLEKIIKYYDVKDFDKALHDAHAGTTVKAVLMWN